MSRTSALRQRACRNLRQFCLAAKYFHVAPAIGHNNWRPTLEILEARLALATMTFQLPPGASVGSWETAANWSGAPSERAPASGDLAVIDGFDATVTGLNPPPHGVGSVAERLRLFNGDLTISDWGSLRLGTSPGFNVPEYGLPAASLVAAGAALNMLGGSLVVHFQDLEVDGELNWSGGDMLGSIINRGSMLFAGSGDLTLNSAAGLTNQSTVVHAGTGDLRGRVTNETGALYDLQSDVGTTSAFVNAGTLRKSGGTGISHLSGLLTNSGGRIEVETGTLVVGSSPGFTIVYDGGHFHVDSGATLDLTGGSTNGRFAGLLTGSGDGTVLFAGGAAAVQAPGATFNFPDNLFQWTGGILSGGAHGLNNTGFINLSGVAEKRAGGIWNNAGTIEQSGTGMLRLIATLNNLPGGLYDMQSDAGFFDVGNNGVVHNAGTFQKSGGSGAARIDVPLTNTGELNVLSGQLRSDASIANEGGEILIARGAVLGPRSFIQAAGGTLSLELDGATFGQLQVDTGVTLAGALNLSEASPVPGTFTILDKIATQAISGTFDGLPEGSVLSTGGTLYRISYVGGTGNDVTLTNLGPANRPPTAVAGGPYAIVEGQGLTLDASTFHRPGWRCVGLHLGRQRRRRLWRCGRRQPNAHVDRAGCARHRRWSVILERQRSGGRRSQPGGHVCDRDPRRCEHRADNHAGRRRRCCRRTAFHPLAQLRDRSRSRRRHAVQR